jgi:hypothetical protein
MAKRALTLIMGLFLSMNMLAQSVEQHGIDVHLYRDTVSIIDPLLPVVTYHNAKNKTVEIRSPFDHIEFSYRRKGEKEWRRMMFLLGVKGMNPITYPPNGKDSAYLFIPLDRIDSIAFRLFKDKAFYPSEDYIQAYELKYVYYPKGKYLNEEEEVVIVLDFVVRTFYPKEEKKTIDWILSLENRRFIPYQTNRSPYNDEEALSIVRRFRELFPESHYLPHAMVIEASALKMTASKDHAAEVHKEWLKLLLKAREKTDNPMLLNKIDRSLPMQTLMELNNKQLDHH